MLSIIIPTHNEIKSGFIQRSFKTLSDLEGVEVIIVDSHSTDGTKQLAMNYGFQVIDTLTNSRATRLNLGINVAKFELILLHHPRSLLDNAGINYLTQNQSNFKWGAFTHKFDVDSFMLRFTSFYSNYIRGKRGIFYLDHCIFAKKSLLKSIGMVPEVDIFEDTLLSIKLRSKAWPKLLAFNSTTSAIRFNKNGFWNQAIKNQLLKLKYYLKLDHKIMNKDYEKGLELNSQYTEKPERK